MLFRSGAGRIDIGTQGRQLRNRYCPRIVERLETWPNGQVAEKRGRIEPPRKQPAQNKTAQPGSTPTLRCSRSQDRVAITLP